MPVSHKATLKLLAFASTGIFCVTSAFAAHRTVDDKSLPVHVIHSTSQSAAQGDSRQLAEKTIADGQALQVAGNADSFRKALAKYESALSLWQKIDDRKGQAEALDLIGSVHYFLDEKQQALEAF